MADTPMVPLAVVTDLIGAIREALTVPDADYEHWKARCRLLEDRAVTVRYLLGGATPDRFHALTTFLRREIDQMPITYPVREPSKAGETR